MRFLLAALVLACGCSSSTNAPHDLGAPGEDLAPDDLAVNDLSPASVSGRIIDATGAPLAGFQVLVGATMVTTDVNGAFSVDAPTTPYDLTIGGIDSRGVSDVERWEGLSRRDPTLMARGVLAPQPSPSPPTGTLSGTLLAVPSPLPVESYAVVASEDGQILASLHGGQAPVFVNTPWTILEPSSSTQLDVLVFTYRPRSYLGYGSVPVTLTSSPVSFGTLTLTPPPTQDLTATIVGPPGLTGGSAAIALAHVGPKGSFGQLVSMVYAGYDVDYPLPAIGAQFDVSISADLGAGSSTVFLRGATAGMALGNITLPDAVDPILIADAGVTLSSQLAVSSVAPGKVYQGELQWTDTLGHLSERLVHTTQSTFAIPDGAPFGLPSVGAPGTAVTWRGETCTLGSSPSAIDLLGNGVDQEQALPPGQLVPCYTHADINLGF